MHLSTDILSGEVSYPCECGRTARVHVTELRPGSVDYCGCGQFRISLNHDQVNEYRAAARVGRLRAD
ncbi:MAG: hypothetical protein GKS06_20435 [Acidobacteria bacterium]|nr:hypothetical protein [Acidobacteriota bacterium]